MMNKLLVLLLAAASCDAAESQCALHLYEIGATKVDLPTPFNYGAGDTACRAIGMGLLLDPNLLNDTERALCGDHPVPLNIGANVSTESSDYFAVWAVSLSSNQTLKASYEYDFNCLLCQHEVVRQPFLPEDDRQGVGSRFQVFLSSTEAKETDELTKKVKKALKDALRQQLQLWHSLITFQSAWLDDDQHLQIEYRVRGSIPHWLDTTDTEVKVLNDSYTRNLVDKSSCRGEETVGLDGAVISWPTTMEGSTAFAKNAKTGQITGRDCRFNEVAYLSEWPSQQSRWQLKWGACEMDFDVYNYELYFLPILGEDAQHTRESVLHQFTLTPLNASTLKSITKIVNQELQLTCELIEKTRRDLVEITSKLVLATEFLVVNSPGLSVLDKSTSIIVADLEGSDRFVGFTVDSIVKRHGTVRSITLNRNPTLHGRASFALDISATLVEVPTRVTFVAVWYVLPVTFDYRQNYVSTGRVDVTIMFPCKGEVSAWGFASYGNHHVDITYQAKAEDSDMDLSCIAWNNVLRKWVSQGCLQTYTGVGGFSACRCSAKFFFLQDGVPIAKYALATGFQRQWSRLYNNPLTDFLKDKIGLMTATAIEGLLSVLGLGSILCTAILFKHWRENTGHKILLHMVFALTCNLVLGFVINFTHMSVESVSCLVYGVLRHYSFLAMFLWMLVLSFLQLKRLMTVAGAKATTHLVLKVSVFAWGVPLVPIIILLSISTGFYQVDRFDRGYCYPQGLIFHLTVQGPAGLILLVNLGVFVAIVTLIFECRGDKKITRHSKNQRAEQLNKLKTSFFIFFLFGFSWVFHILSEERVIPSDFLFEYLFLMTATFHIFVLSLFFVVFQDSTRKDWLALINNVCK